MFKKILTHKAITLLLFCILSLCAGLINGFLGTGGGIVLVYMLSFLTKNEKKDNFPTSLCATIPISLIALISYAKNQSIDFDTVKGLIIPCALGGLLGAFLVDRLKLKWLNTIFALLVIYAGTCMILR